MGEFIKKTSQAGGSKRKETHIAHKRFRDETKRKLEEREKIIEEKESKYLKKKFKSKYITEKKKEIKTEVKKGFITKKEKEPVIDLRVEFAHGSRPTGGGVATHGLGRAFLKGGKV